MWSCLWVNGFKPHVVSNRLSKELSVYLKDKDKNKDHGELIEKIEGVTIDLPGMILASRSYQVIKLDTLSISIPNMDFENLFYNLKLAKPIDLTFNECYRLVGYMHCLVLTLEQKELLLQGFEELLPNAKKIASIENGKFTEAIDQLEANGSFIIPHNKNKGELN